MITLIFSRSVPLVAMLTMLASTTRVLALLSLVLALSVTEDKHVAAEVLSDGGASATSSGGEPQNQLFQGVRSASAAAQSVDSLMNDASGTASLTLDSGSLTASAHGCSGGGPGFGGLAGGAGGVEVTETYTLVSTTLPEHVLVPVTFTYTSAARVTAVYDSDDMTNGFALARASAVINLFSNATLVSKFGELARDADRNGQNDTNTGNFDPASGSDTISFNLFVGQQVTLSVTGRTQASSNTNPGAVVDGNAQLSIGWGFSVLSPEAFLRSTDDPTYHAPPLIQGSPAVVIAALPPPPGPVVGDINGDSAVDAGDAGVLFSNWGENGAGDVNNDDIVDAADAGLMFEHWTGDSVTHALPEPSRILLAACGLLTNVFLRTRPKTGCRPNRFIATKEGELS